MTTSTRRLRTFSAAVLSLLALVSTASLAWAAGTPVPTPFERLIGGLTPKHLIGIGVLAVLAFVVFGVNVFAPFGDRDASCEEHDREHRHLLGGTDHHHHHHHGDSLGDDHGKEPRPPFQPPPV